MSIHYKPDILFEDNHLIVINKKSGDIVQGDKTGDNPLNELLKAYLKTKYNKPGNVYLGTVHRLDRPTSGLVIFAKTSKALTRMNKLFQTKTIQKTYWAVTEKAPKAKSGQLVDYLLKNEKQNKSYAYNNSSKGGKQAILNYQLVGKGERYFYVEVKPLTGRHHQIRVQLSNINCIIKGDLKYGAKRPNKDGSIHLHARAIEFIHPVSKEKIEITAPVPEDVIWHDFQNKVT
ncbi:MAG: RluA family pseudouridine synthase [Putridiphycobacter sp.]|nr:RluA family pseudouridine synthase [Putridiphycobacter sp.]